MDEVEHEVEPEADDQMCDPMEWLRLSILALGLALNFYVLWDQYRDHPEVLVMRHRARTWWERTVAGPRREARRVRKEQGAVIFEAMQIVEGST